MITSASKSSPPFSGLAAYYDLIHANKDYAGEAMRAARYFWPNSPVFELGCGTGTYLAEFRKLGYITIGFDRSISMLERARAKYGDAATLREYDFLSPPGDGPKTKNLFSGFATLGYACRAADDILTVFRNCRTLVHPRGRFVFDVIQYSAALTSLIRWREYNIPTPDGELTYSVEKFFDPYVAVVGTTLTVQRMPTFLQEQHYQRAFAPREIETLLEATGFRTVAIVPLERYDDEHVRPEDWGMLCVAEAV